MRYKRFARLTPNPTLVLRASAPARNRVGSTHRAKQVQRGVLEQHDRLRVDDLAALVARGLRVAVRKTVRRARALSDVLLPELGRTIADIETRLEEMEQEDAILLRSTR